MKVDTVIVGAGSAGLSALREVRRYTKDFLLVNSGHWGTTCAAVGCMPSKALIEAANAFHRRGALEEFGIRGADGLHADIPAVMARVRQMRDSFVRGPESVPDKLGERALSGRARLLGPGRLEVDGKTIEARAIILAPGSRPVVPGPWRDFGDRILTTDSLFEQSNLPRRIAVIGMGAIGVEIAQALSRLGLEVAGFDAVEGLAGIDDAEILAAFRPLIESEVALHLGAPAELEAMGDAIRVTGAGGSFKADAVLAAMGRRPNIDDLGLETLGVPLDDRGMPEIEPATLRIGDLPVFLAGDANGYRPLLHEAADEGHIAGRMAAPDAEDSGLCRRTPLSIVFSAPQVARIGPPLSELNDQDIATGSAEFSNQPRARMAQTGAGILRIHAERQTGRLLAAEMCVPAAEHLVHLLALAVEAKMTVADVLAMPFYHPVLEEGLRSALRDLAKNVAGAGGSDLSDCKAIGHDALD
ncbi:dihydrolipoyl dehydrogenase [Lutimaribacter sp. EGI FJ00015]|uniref:Dihydrolipoyl dehydrogenase n=1 Tax=Lutimaribacter degradans TaxID=2945989 RepID=A0ACC6A0N6_9RHOB|nr:dihydrolipoyl dehydrogenase [Lutimaribacter sp. EGI FJ00013]MCM2563630.1 dihydrolipoyl dehydrogenase [Lutimaribacter sp. EGI FJ00013]MCO0614834.1 dihydrolipoyl dehydrogenase [Lutimaribacter sp. EGI FJ00015]MCO0637482.1 dihydrolipoyl dehydrogenase [Lutimaribacter sp. EGI FJ00014]